MDEVLDDFIGKYSDADILIKADADPILIFNAPFCIPEQADLWFNYLGRHEKDDKTYSSDVDSPTLIRMFGALSYSAYVLKNPVTHVNFAFNPDGRGSFFSSNHSLYTVGDHTFRGHFIIGAISPVTVPYNLGFMLRHFRPDFWRDNAHRIVAEKWDDFDQKYRQACGATEIALIEVTSDTSSLPQVSIPHFGEPVALQEIRRLLNEIDADLDARVERLRLSLEEADNPHTPSALTALSQDLEALHITIELTLGRDVVEGNRAYLDLVDELRTLVENPNQEESEKPEGVAAWFSWASRFRKNGQPQQKNEPLTRIENLVKKANLLVRRSGDRVVVSRAFQSIYDQIDGVFGNVCSRLETLIEGKGLPEDSDDHAMLKSKLANLQHRRMAVQQWRDILPGLSRSAIMAQGNMDASTTNMLGVHANLTQVVAAQSVLHTQSLANDTAIVMEQAQRDVRAILAAAQRYSQETGRLLGHIDSSTTPVAKAKPEPS